MKTREEILDGRIVVLELDGVLLTAPADPTTRPLHWSELRLWVDGEPSPFTGLRFSCGVNLPVVLSVDRLAMRPRAGG